MSKAPKSKIPFTLENLDLIIEAHDRQVKLRNMYKGNPVKFDIVKYREAKANVEAIEAGLSILVFGFTGANFSQCLDALNY
jgi:hypothetical protein